MLKRSFKPAKCNTSLRLAVSRVKTLRNKRENLLKQMKRDLAQLLETGQDQTARIRVEHYVREEKTLAAYDIIQVYCELIIARMPIIESQKNCPIDLKEAICSVIFASPRCTDIVELVDVQKHFTAKYGKDFISAALDLRPNSGVNRIIVEKLSAKTPDGESKIRILTGIAQEYSVKWDPKAFSEEISKPAEDLLDGPKKFDSSSKMLAGSFGGQIQSPDVQIKSANEQFLAPPVQKHDSYSRLSENNVTRFSPSSDAFSSDKGLKPTSSMPSPSHPQLGPSGVRTSRTEDLDFSDNIAFHNQHHWNMEFKDAASAAQAAAESAEMASLAARAAAQLSRAEKRSTQSPTEVHRSYFEQRNETPIRSTGSKNESRRNTTEIGDDSANSFYRMQTELHSNSKDRLEQGHISGEAESRSHQHDSVTRKSSRSVSSQFIATSVDDEIAVNNLQKADLGDISPNGKYVQHSNMPFYSNSDGTTADMDSSSDPNVHKPSSDQYEHDPASVGYGYSERMNGQPDFGDSSSAVFDQSGSDDEHHVEQETYYSRHSSFPFEESKVRSRKVDPWGPSEQVSRTFFSEPIDQSSESLMKNSVPLEAKDSLPARFDDSDGFSSENEEIGNRTSKGRNESIFLSREEEYPSGSHFSAQSDHGHLKFSGRVKEGVVPGDIFAYVSPDDTESGEKNSFGQPPSRYSSTKKESDKDLSYGKRAHNFESAGRNMSGSLLLSPGSSFSSQTSYVTQNPHNEEGKVNKKEDFLYKSSDDSESDDGHITSQRSSRFSSTQEVEDFGNEHPSLSTVSSKNSNYSSHGSENRLNLGQLTGGFRNKGLIRPPYVKPTSKEETKNEVPTISEATPLSQSDKLFTVHKPQETKLDNLKIGVHKELKSKVLVSESDSDDAEEIQPHRNLNARVPEGRIVYPRTRDSSSKLVSDGPSGLTARYRDPVDSGLNAGIKASQVGASSKPRIQNVASGSKDNSPKTGLFLKQEPKHPQVVNPVAVEESQKVLSDKAGASETTSLLNSESDSDDAEKIQPRRNFNVRGQESRFASRRTRNSPSKSVSDGSTGFTAWSRDPLREGNKGSQAGSSSKPQESGVASGSKEKSSRIDSFLKQEPRRPQAEIPVEKVEESQKLRSQEKARASEIPSLRTTRVTSRESSLKGASHVHPKLPDYESLAAHFENLRANRRT